MKCCERLNTYFDEGTGGFWKT